MGDETRIAVVEWLQWMWDRFFRQRAYIGITRSRMRWYLRKKFLTWVKIAEISIRYARKYFLAHRIRKDLSDILLWYRKSYLTHAILPRLSHEGFINWLFCNSRTLSSSDVIVTFLWRHHVKLHLTVLKDFSNLIFKQKKTAVSKKNNPLFVWG